MDKTVAMASILGLSHAAGPHTERGGYHLDRFDAYLGDELITTSRQPIYDGARELLKRGHDPEALMCADQKGHLIFKRSIGENAKLTVEESDKRGLRLRGWRPFYAPGSGDIASPAAAMVA